jgi:ribosomal protein L2
MSQARVRALVGEPLEQWRPYRHTNDAAKRHYVSYDYSRSEDGEGDYEIRQIHFDRGRVAEVIRYRYYD